MIIRWVRQRIGDSISASGGDDVRVCCPFCDARVGRPDMRHHLYISLVKPVAHCFRCDWRGHWVGLIMAVDGCTYPEALKYIEQPLPDVGRFEQLHSPRGLVQAQEIVSEPDGFVPFGLTITVRRDGIEVSAVRTYLHNRNVPPNLIATHFGWVRGTHRAWILIDANWWQGRLIIAGEPKYISPPWPRVDSLWNAAALSEFTHIHVCEGVFSAIAQGRNAIGICGKTITVPQADRIVAAGPESVTIALDADASSNAHAMATVLEQRGYTGDICIQYMLKGDPADGVVGDTVGWDWGTSVRFALGGMDT